MPEPAGVGSLHEGQGFPRIHVVNRHVLELIRALVQSSQYRGRGRVLNRGDDVHPRGDVVENRRGG